MIPRNYCGLWTHKWRIAYFRYDLLMIVCCCRLSFSLDISGIVFKWLNTVDPVARTVHSGEFLDLFVCLTWNELQFLWPNVPGAREIQHFLSCCIYNHRSNLIAWKSLIFEWILLSQHFIQYLVAFGRNFFGCLLRFYDVFVILTFEKHTVC